MDIEESNTIKLHLSDLDSLDPVTIFLEDFSTGVGRITIVCFGEAWSALWGGMGDNKIVEFFCSCDEHYIAKNLSRTPGSITDYEQISKDIGCDVDRDSMGFYTDKLSDAYGCEWYMDLPQTSNPEYRYLCRIIFAVQAGLRKQFNIGK